MRRRDTMLSVGMENIGRHSATPKRGIAVGRGCPKNINIQEGYIGLLQFLYLLEQGERK